jgi:hypothetical protein
MEITQYVLTRSEKQLYENSLRAKAVGIVHSCISMLGSMSGVYKVVVLFVLYYSAVSSY